MQNIKIFDDSSKVQRKKQPIMTSQSQNRGLEPPQNSKLATLTELQDHQTVKRKFFSKPLFNSNYGTLSAH